MSTTYMVQTSNANEYNEHNGKLHSDLLQFRDY